MILRDEAKKSAQKSSEEAAIDVKLTVNLHFSSINCSGDNLCFIDPFQRYLKGKKWQINGVFENVLVGVLFWNSKFRESFQIFRKSVLQTVITGVRECCELFPSEKCVFRLSVSVAFASEPVDAHRARGFDAL